MTAAQEKTGSETGTCLQTETACMQATFNTDDFNADSFYTAFMDEAARLGLDGPSLLPAGRVSVFDEIDSTNSELLRRLASGGPLLNADGSRTDRGKQLSGSLVAAATQKAGRGRIGRSFYSPGRNGIYFSFLHIPEGGISDPGRCTATAAVGVCRAIDRLYGIRSGIKWVNDIYIAEKKVCGILTEGWMPAETRQIDPSPSAPLQESSALPQSLLPPAIQAAVIGIGINIRTDGQLPPELARKAGGVADQAVLLGCPEQKAAAVSRTGLLASCMAHILQLFRDGTDVQTEYASRSILTGRDVMVIPLIGDAATRYRARVEGIGKDFSLRVRMDDGQEKELISGEVSLQLE